MKQNDSASIKAWIPHASIVPFEAVAVSVPGKTKETGASNRNDPLDDDTMVPPLVFWDEKHRSFQNRVTAFIFGTAIFLCYIFGLIIVWNARPKYKYLTDGSKMVSDNFLGDVNECCESIDSSGASHQSRGLCGGGVSPEFRLLKAKGSYKTFDGDDGIFDAFLEVPYVIFGLLCCVISLAYIYLMLLQHFTTKVMIVTGFGQVFLLLCIALLVPGWLGLIILIFTLTLIWYVHQRLHVFKKAARIISHSIVALRKNSLCMILAIIQTNTCYLMLGGLFLIFICMSFEVVEVSQDCNLGSNEDSSNNSINECACIFQRPWYISKINLFQCIVWIWMTLFFRQIRLFVVSMMVGSWHFQQHQKPTGKMLLKSITKSFGTLALASIVLTLFESMRISRKPGCLCCCLMGPQALFILPFNIFCWIWEGFVGSFINVFTRFSLIYHAFTSLSLQDSAKKCFGLMDRHFEGAYVTDITSRKLLNSISCLFSFLMALVAWAWIDKEFHCQTFPFSDSNHQGPFDLEALAWIIFILVNIHFPMFGIFIIFIVNTTLARGKYSSQDSWVSPVAAAFVGCISMLFFDFVGGVVLDIVDVLFLCFSIDRDVDVVDLETDSFAKLLNEEGPFPGCCVIAKPVKMIDPEVPMAKATVIGTGSGNVVVTQELQKGKE